MVRAHTMAWRTVLPVALLALAGVACGGGGTESASTSGSSTTTVAPSSTTVASATTTVPAGAATTSSVPDRYASSVEFASPDSSRYTYTPAVGTIKALFGKNINTSPPGQARIAVTGGPSEASGFPGTITGTKTNGTAPALAFTGVVRLVWPVTKGQWEGIVDGATPAQSCRAESQTDASLAEALKDPKLPAFGLMCTFDLAAGAAWSYLSDEFVEGYVDQVVGRGLVVVAHQPYLVLTAGPKVGTTGTSFRIVLAPDGTSKVTPL